MISVFRRGTRLPHLVFIPSRPEVARRNVSILVQMTLLSLCFVTGHNRCAFAGSATSSLATSQIVTGPQNNVTAPAGSVILQAGEDISAAVASHAAGTTFFLQAGIYRTPQVMPLPGDRFIGAYGATLNGALLLTAISADGTSLYAATNIPPSSGMQIAGVCSAAFPRCNYPQDLYFDDKPLRAVASLNDVAPGAWYLDDSSHTVYFADDPSGHVVELSYSPYAFGGPASNIVIQNLTVEKFACADQHGAIADSASGPGWVIRNNSVKLNHGYGIRAGSNYTVSGNIISSNGEMGLGGSGTNILINGNEISYNVWNGTDCGWECGGAKFGGATKLIPRLGERDS